MTCVYKEYEIKIKMVQEQWLQLKNEVFVVFKHGNCFIVGRELTFGGGGIKIRWGRSLLQSYF